ncbi:a0b476ac-209d-4a3f-bf69-f14ecd4d24f4 [Sclerotinia trifoliorum]|uniref:A0b476ac-209d-4a3f-bf69-f14ecd4d24f4 n=1 Tax=Sclerotinia trifoliorum TaxID=28548 RepID=A0A8H2VZ34_9HELO|nr:a0b476ac-209d-4a3f-bf69-f14ecd4d24f4 [Sclerotinia trifoliorum]
MHLRPVTRDDLSSIADIASEAYRDDSLQRIFFPPKAVENGSQRRKSMLRIRKRLVEASTRCIVSVSDEKDEFWSGKPELLGYANWTRVGKSEAANNWQIDSLLSKLERTLITAEMWYTETFLDRDLPWDKIHHVRTLTANSFGSIPEYFELAGLAVRPKFHRRGIGGMMLKYGIDLAQEEQIPVLLQASAVGTRLYTKFGFQEIRKTEVFPEVIAVAMQLDPKD